MTLYPINLLRCAVTPVGAALKRSRQRLLANAEIRRWRRDMLRQLGRRRRD
jgi:hypothetical protein